MFAYFNAYIFNFILEDSIFILLKKNKSKTIFNMNLENSFSYYSGSIQTISEESNELDHSSKRYSKV